MSSPPRQFVFYTFCSRFVSSPYFAQEHKCVLDSCRKLQEEGFDVTYLPVQKNGVISLEELEHAIRPDTSLISIMTVNNETGVIQPVREIGAIARKHRGIYFHTDAAQATGKIPLDVNAMNVDLMSISGHKLYGPKGIGAAYVRRRPRVRLDPILSGGGQERGLRSGTVPAALAVGIGEAARIAKQEMAVSTVLEARDDVKLHTSFAGERAANEGHSDLPRPSSRLRNDFCAGVLSAACSSLLLPSPVC